MRNRHHARARDRRELVDDGWRRHAVLVADDHERRRRDAPEVGAKVEGAHGLGACGIAVRRDPAQLVDDAIRLRGVAERRREPPLAGAVDDHLDALTPHERGALVVQPPACRVGRRCRRGRGARSARMRSRRAIARPCRRARGRRTSALDPELVEQREQRACDVVDRRRGRPARASARGRDDRRAGRDARRERRDLRVPHRGGRAEAAREHEHRCVVGAVEGVRELHVVSR